MLRDFIQFVRVVSDWADMQVKLHCGPLPTYIALQVEQVKASSIHLIISRALRTKHDPVSRLACTLSRLYSSTSTCAPNIERSNWWVWSARKYLAVVEVVNVHALARTTALRVEVGWLHVNRIHMKTTLAAMRCKLTVAGAPRSHLQAIHII